MDGTFLDNPKNYDRALFGKLLAKMKDQGVHLIVASGNQYARLQDDFRECFQEIDFVAENGAYLLGKGKEMLAQTLNPKTVEKIVQFQKNIKDSHLALNGIKSAYMLKSEDKDYLKSRFYYCPSHTLVDSFDKLPDDRFIKLNLAVPAEDIKQTVARLTEMFGAEVHVTSSGFGDIDIIKKGVNKAQGLETMLKRWNLTGEDLAAFGDGGNDIEMLRFAKYSYAMANADPEVKKVSQYSTLSNNESGVLKALEELLND
ncbi:Cof-type HAD-IIB family hydrolase [Ligilactobacillus sp. WC1T17]